MAHAWTTGCPDRLTCLQPHQNTLRLSGQPAAQTDSLVCSPTRVLCTSPNNRLPRMDSLACSPTRTLCASLDNRRPRHSLVCSPTRVLCTSLVNWLPRADSLACSHTGTLCASLWTNYPGTLMPVTSHPHRLPPDM
jgi:hypothetical protein